MSVSEIVQFLEARLAEDEAVAREAITPDRPGTHWEWESTADDDDPESPRCLCTVEEFPTKSGVGDLPGFPLYGCRADPSPAMDHIARHDPARVLREVAAKRAVMSRHREVKEDDELGWMWSRYASDHNRSQPCAGCGVWGDPDLPVTDRVEDCPELHALASVYADHCDFNPDWAE